MNNKVKSEQILTVASAKRVAVFQVSMKVVEEEARGQPSNRDNKLLTSH